MAAFYIELESGSYYQFNAPATAYPSNVRDLLGVTDDPASGLIFDAGTYADYAIIRVRLKVKLSTGDFKNLYRLCDVDKVSTAKNSIGGVNAFGGQILGLAIPRKRVRL